MSRREEQPAIEGNGRLRREGKIIGTVKYVLTPFKVYATENDMARREPEEVLDREEIEGTMEETDDRIDVLLDDSLTLEMPNGDERTIMVTGGNPSNRSYSFVVE